MKDFDTLPELVVPIEETVVAPPSLPLDEYLRQKYERDSRRDGTKPLGYPLTKFKQFEEATDGIQPGFYIIGAETNKGKTAFLVNLFLDVLDTNPETTGIYFSLDDSKDVIINRILSIKSGIRLNTVQKRQASNDDQDIIKGYYDYLIDLYKAGRFFLKDISEVNTLEVLEKEIAEKADQKLFVMIDGLYNLDLGQKYKGLREENIDRANKVKALCDTYRVPIITTGELRKRPSGDKDKNNPERTTDDLMETGKFAYNANLVVMLYPQSPEKFKTEKAPILMADFVKNKLNHFTRRHTYQFTRETSLIKYVELNGYGNIK